jgi:tetratricopeptide (TPR) repeat protein
MQGIHYGDKQNIPDAIYSLQCFNEAVALEPNFVNPYFNIAERNAFFAHAGIFNNDIAAENCGKAAAKAIQIDPLNAWSQLAAGINAFFFVWDMEKAGRCLEKSIELNRNLGIAYRHLAWYQLVMLQRDRIDESLRISSKLDPMNGLALGTAAEISFLAGELDVSMEYCNEALTIDPRNDYASAIKSFVIGFQGDWKKTIEILLPIYEIEPDFNFAIFFLGYAYAKAGQLEKAKSFISILEEKQKNPDAPALHHLISIMYLGVGDKDKFYEYYELSMRSKLFTTLHYYKSPLLAEISGEERIQNLRREFNLPV